MKRKRSRTNAGGATYTHASEATIHAVHHATLGLEHLATFLVGQMTETPEELSVVLNAAERELRQALRWVRIAQEKP